MDKHRTALRSLEIAQAISGDAPRRYVPPREAIRSESEGVLASELIEGTRGYLERVLNQINGSYERGWYDACAVMMRRILETLLIEAFEAFGIADAVKHPQTGSFMMLGDLIGVATREQAWNLGRGTRKALPKLKNLGDMSAHGRRYNARQDDIDRVRDDFRLVCEELLYLARLR